jgi:NAD(P)-dependent dehydrogenase (short-subunit alcohol dehydrogenase family)
MPDMNRTAIVTGGTGGLGVAVTKQLLDDGWKVIVPWRDERELDRIEEHERLTLVEADLFDEQSVAAVAAKAGKSLRAVVNLVGGFSEGGLVHETPIDDFERQFRLNLRATYLMSAAAIPALLAGGGGAIVCVSTRAALKPFKGAAGYITSKAAVLSFVDVLDVEYRKQGIRANAILPSVIDTPANRKSSPDDDFSKWVKPKEIAAVIGGLVSDEYSAITGSRVKVYGKA